MNKLITLISLFILFAGCSDIDSSVEGQKDDENAPEQLEFTSDVFNIDNNYSTVYASCFNSSSWHVSVVSEIINSDTTNYFFSAGDDIQGDWFTMIKNNKLLDISIKKNRLGGERYLKIKIESNYSKGVEITIKQYPDSKYVESDEGLTKKLIGKWIMVAYANNFFSEEWIYVEDKRIVEFLEDGTYLTNNSDMYPLTYKINEKYFFLRMIDFDLDEEETAGVGVWIYNYSFNNDLLKFEIVSGDYIGSWAIIYKRITNANQ